MQQVQAFIVFTILLLYFVSRIQCENKFKIAYQWNYFNFTWQCPEHYARAVKNGKYIPQNILTAGMRFDETSMYISFPKIRKGVPVTLCRLSHRIGKTRTNEVFSPYPSWEMNDDSSCSNLQSVQSMEIDTKGIMWVLDGVRMQNNLDCPSKLVFLDTKNNGKVVHTYIFPKEVCLQKGAYLNDIVVDETDGGFAYMTDASNMDPGLIVYSKDKNCAWKLRDSTMFAVQGLHAFPIDGVDFKFLIPIDGIAMSPRSEGRNKTVYYSALTALKLYSISSAVLKDEEKYKSGDWRTEVRAGYEKQGLTDGMMMDSEGVLFYTLIDRFGLGKWDTSKPFNTSKVLYTNKKTIIWPDTLAIDHSCYLCLLSDHASMFINLTIEMKLSKDIKFRIQCSQIGTKSYLYG